MISNTLVKALQEQFTTERQNQAGYLALADALEFYNWPGLSKFMRKSASEEAEHANKFASYLIDRSIKPIYEMLTGEGISISNANDMLSFVNYAYQLELATTEKIKTLKFISEQEEDPQTCAFLHWFLLEQTESERTLLDMITEIQRANLHNLSNAYHMLLDNKYGETV